MNFKKLAIIFSIIMGSCMIIMWIVFISSNSVPEIQTKPLELTMHLTAEFITSISLIVGALGLLKEKLWANKVYFFSMGMLIYTLIMSSGYFLEKKEIPFFIMFMSFLFLSIIITFKMVKNN